MKDKRINIIIPFSRYDLSDMLIKLYSESAKYINSINLIEYGTPKFVSKEIKNGIYNTPVNCFSMSEHQKQWDWCYEKLNWFVNNNYENINDDDYYMFVCDDDAVFSTFFEQLDGYIRQNPNVDIFFVSMKRGLRVPDNGQKHKHPITTLYATPETIGLYKTGLEQYIVKGSILKKMQFMNDSCADGYMAEVLMKCNGTKAFIKDLYVNFNYFEKGRWM